MQKIISGISTRTTNENHQSYKDLETLRWEFMKRDLKSAFWENLVSPLVYAVYTNYEKDFQSWAYDVYLWFETKGIITDFDSLIVNEENFKIFEFEYTTAQDVTNAREKIWSLTDYQENTRLILKNMTLQIRNLEFISVWNKIIRR